MSIHPFFKGFLKISFKFLLIKSKKKFTVILSKNESAGAKKNWGGRQTPPPSLFSVKTRSISKMYISRPIKKISVIMCERRYDTSKSILYKNLMSKIQSWLYLSGQRPLIFQSYAFNHLTRSSQHLKYQSLTPHKDKNYA